MTDAPHTCVVSVGGRTLRGTMRTISSTKLSQVDLFSHSSLTLAPFLPYTVAKLLPIAFVIPRSFVIKCLQPAEYWEECLDNELTAFTKLRPLQGIYVPMTYGLVAIEGDTRAAFALQYLGSNDFQTLYDRWREGKPSDWPSHEKQIRYSVHECYAAITRLGVSHGDAQLRNIMLIAVPSLSKVYRCIGALSIITVAAITYGTARQATYSTSSLIIVLCIFALHRLYKFRPGPSYRSQLIDFGFAQVRDSARCHELNEPAADSICDRFFCRDGLGMYGQKGLDQMAEKLDQMNSSERKLMIGYMKDMGLKIPSKWVEQ